MAYKAKLLPSPNWSEAIQFREASATKLSPEQLRQVHVRSRWGLYPTRFLPKAARPAAIVILAGDNDCSSPCVCWSLCTSRP